METQNVKPIISVEVETKGCRAEFYLNDVALTLLDAKEASKESMPVNQFVLDGVNHLLVVVEPGPTPSAARTADKKIRSTQGMSVLMRMMRYPEGAFPGDPSGVQLARIEWAGKEQGTAPMPLELTAQCDIGVWRGQWSWIRARPLVLDAKTVAQVTDILQQIHVSLTQGNPDVLLRLQATKFAEVSRAFGLDPSSEPAETRAWLIENLKKAGEMPNLDPATFDFRLCGNRRMIDCIAKDWQPIIRSKAGDGQMLFDMKIAYLDNRFQIVR